MKAIYIKDKSETLHQKLDAIAQHLTKTRPAELSLKDLQKLGTSYNKTTVLKYLIEKAFNEIPGNGQEDKASV